MPPTVRNSQRASLTKIAIDLPEGAPTQQETLWAERLGQNLFRLDNTPWYARDCALDDVIFCEEKEGQLPRFIRVVRPSGNRTLRLFVPDTAGRAAVKTRVFKTLDEAGCFYEEFGSNKGLIAVTVPHTVDLEQVLARLKEFETSDTAYWESGNF